MPRPPFHNRAAFVEPTHFSKAPGTRRWYCNACYSTASGRSHMSLGAALRHERSMSHIEKVRGVRVSEWDPQPDVSGWMNGTPEGSLWDLKELEKRQHVDALKEFIPFWQQQVEAASRGVELRWETFLGAVDEEAQEVAWDVSGWGIEDAEEKTSQTESRRSRGERWGSGSAWGKCGDPWATAQSPGSGSDGKHAHPVDPDAYNFVEKIASKKSVSDERRQQMHAFYQMPTDKKVARIQELLVGLHMHGQQ